MLKLKEKKLILASASPRRKNLLEGLDIDFEVRVKECDENYPDDIQLRDVARYLAQKKSDVYANELQDNEIIICCDTTVLKDNDLLNKPNGAAEAKRMLQKLSGNQHEVITGVCIRSKEKNICFDVISKVWFNRLEDDEIDYYIEKYKPYDKAGSYGIQEWLGYIAIEKIEGSYYNIMGMPVHRIYEELKRFE
jgi:septum formation protein